MRSPLRSIALIGLAASALFAALPATASEESFEVSLGGNRLGRITHALSGGTRDLTLLLDSTPLGVFNGSYAGRSVTSGPVTRHTGRTRSTRKSRDLSMTIDGGALREVSLLPEEERTALTAPGAVTGPVLDPVSGFGALLETSSCPDGLQIYDGRRVGRFSLEEEQRTSGQVACQTRYRVISGPGYLEPLGISQLSVEMTYDAGTTPWRLLRIGARSGPFTLAVDRAGR